MKVKEFMTPNVVCANTNMNVYEVAKLMNDNHIGSMPICDQNNKVVGIVTDRDIILRNVACNKPTSTPITEVMTQNAITITSDTQVEEASEIMSQNQIRRIPVVDNNVVVGVVSIGDLAEKEQFGDEEVGSCLCDICKPTKNN